MHAHECGVCIGQQGRAHRAGQGGARSAVQCNESRDKRGGWVLQWCQWLCVMPVCEGMHAALTTDRRY